MQTRRSSIDRSTSSASTEAHSDGSSEPLESCSLGGRDVPVAEPRVDCRRKCAAEGLLLEVSSEERSAESPRQMMAAARHEDHPRRRRVEGRLSSSRVCPVDHHRSAGRQQHIGGVEIAVNQCPPVRVRNLVQAMMELGERSHVQRHEPRTTQDLLVHRRPRDRFQDETVVAHLVHAWYRIAVPARVLHQARFALGVPTDAQQPPAAEICQRRCTAFHEPSFPGSPRVYPGSGLLA